MVMKSAWRNKSSLLTYSTPASLHFSGVRFWLQAMISFRTPWRCWRYGCRACRGRGRQASDRRGPCRSCFARHARLHPRVLVADAPRQLEHQADGDAGGRVAHRRGAADHDAAPLGRRDVDRGIAQAGRDQQLEVRQLRSRRAGSGASRMAQTMPKPCKVLATFSRLPRCSLNTLMSISPETLDQSVTLSTTFW